MAAGHPVRAAISKYDRFGEFILQEGFSRFRYQQILQAIFQHRIGRFAEMSALPKALRDAAAPCAWDTPAGEAPPLAAFLLLHDY